MGGLNTQTGEYTCPGCGESLDLLPTDASAYVPVAEVIHVGCPDANHDDGNHHAALDHGDVVQAFASLGAGTPPDPTPGTFGLPADQWRIDPTTWKPVVIVEGDLNVGAGYQLVGEPGGVQTPAAAPAGGTAGGTAAPTGTPAGGTAGGTATPTGTPAGGDTGTTSAPIPPIAVPLPAPDPNAAVASAAEPAPDTTAIPPAPAAAPDTGTAEPVPFGGNMTALPVAPQPPGAPAASPDTGTDTGTGTGTPGAVPPATGA